MKKHLLLLSSLLVASIAHSQCSDVFISEYVEGTYNNKAIELYNPTPNPINLNGHYQFGRDRDGAGVPMLMDITGTIPAYGTRVFVIDKRDPNGTGNEIAVDLDLQARADTFVNPVYVQSNSPFYFNGDDAFVLVKDGATILDILGKIGEDPGTGWFVPSDPFTRWWTVDNTLIRKPEIQGGVTANPDVFDPSLEWDSLPSNTYDSLNFHTCSCGSVGIVERAYANHFDIFPNPVMEGQFALKGTSDMESFVIYSSNGSVIARERLSRSQFQNIVLPQSIPGLYLIEIIFTDGARSQRKLIFR